jgi:alpha-mannosidase
MNIKTSAIIIFFFCVLFSFPSFSQEKKDKPGKLLTHLDALEKLVNPEIKWQLTSTDKLRSRTYKTGRSIPSREFTLRTGIEAVSNSCGIGTGNTPMALKLTLYSKGLSEVTILEGKNKLDHFTIDGSSGTGTELKKEIVITNAVLEKTYNISIQVKNKGFKPFRKDYWPPRNKEPEEQHSYFSIKEQSVIYTAAAENYKQLNQWLLSMRIGHAILFPDFKRYTFIGKPFTIEDKRRIRPIRLRRARISLERAIMVLTPELLNANQPENVKNAIRESYRISRPVRRLARNFKVYLIGNAHIDIAWLWRMQETVLVARNTFDTVMNNMEEYPALHFAQSQALAYQWMENRYPEVFERIKQKVKEGKWEIVGGMWVEPDCNLISGESWVRQVLYGKRYFKEKFGVDVDTGWNPDSFGYNWNMPQIYAKSGIKRFITQKIWWNDTTVFPHFIFRWQGVDGTQLMTYFPPVGYTSRVRMPRDMVNIIRYEATTGYRKTLLLYGLGDHGGGPNREILDRVKSYEDLHIKPEFIHSKAIDFLQNIETDLGENIPVWKDELYLEYHRGTYTTQGETKKNNRLGEAALSVSEKLASVVSINDASVPYPGKQLERAWKTVLTNQFHDILPGSSIAPVYRDAAEDYRRSFENTIKQADASLQALSKRIDTSAVKAVPLVVFNSLSWPRTGIVRFAMSLPEDQILLLSDSKGNPVPVAIERKENSNDAVLRFIAKDVPSIGYTVYSLDTVKTPANTPAVTVKQPGGGSGFIEIESPFHKLKISALSGNIVSLWDKKLKREFVAPGKEANVLQVYEDLPARWDAWNIGYTGRMWELNKADSVELVEDNDVRKVVKVKKHFLGLSKNRYSPTEEFPSSFFTQYIILYKDIDRIDTRMEADWWEDHMLLKVAFPVSIESDTASYEIPFAFIERTTKFETLWEKARFEVPALRWADLSQEDAGISLLNDSKYGHDIHGNVIKLSLLRAPKWPDPMADRGKHEFTYSLYTHKGDVTQGETIKRASELNTPFYANVAQKQKGELPASFGFFKVKSGSVILDTIKKAEDGNAYILRLYESSGKESPVEIECFKVPVSVFETDLMEKDVEAVALEGKTIRLKLKKFEIKTLKLTFQ